MKKALCLLLCLLLVGAGSVFTAVKAENAADQVTFAREMLQGDPAAAEGLELSLCADLQDRLLWEIRYDAFSNRAKTDYSYFPSRQPDFSAPSADWLDLRLDLGISAYSSADLLQDSSGQLSGFLPMIRQAMADAGDRQTYTARFRLQDWMQEYPMQVRMMLPEYSSDTIFEDRLAQLWEQGVRDGDPLAQGNASYYARGLAAYALREQMSIPVLPETEVELTLQQNEPGVVNEVTIRSDRAISLECRSIACGESYWFAFSAFDEEGAPVGGKNGLYRVALRKDETGCWPQPAEKVAELTPGMREISCTASPAGDRMFFSGIVGSSLLLEVRDSKTGQLCQAFQLPFAGKTLLAAQSLTVFTREGNSFSMPYLTPQIRLLAGENVLALTTDAGQLLVFGKAGELWEYAFSATLPDSLSAIYYELFALAWDGERFALALAEQWTESCFLLAAERGEITYCARLTPSLCLGFSRSNGCDCLLREQNPISLCWQ